MSESDEKCTYVWQKGKIDAVIDLIYRGCTKSFKILFFHFVYYYFIHINFTVSLTKRISCEPVSLLLFFFLAKKNVIKTTLKCIQYQEKGIRIGRG